MLPLVTAEDQSGLSGSESIIAQEITGKKLDFRHVACALDDRQHWILWKSRITHRELAKVEAGTSVRLDNSRVLTLDA